MISVSISPLLLPSKEGTPTAVIRCVIEDVKEDGSIIEDVSLCQYVNEQLFAVGEPNSANFEPSWRQIPAIKRSDLLNFAKQQQENAQNIQQEETQSQAQ